MKNLSLTKKISGGFGIVLILLMVVSFASWKGLHSVTDGFITYRGLARQTNLAGRLQANMLMVRLSVKGFLNTGSDEDKKEYAEHLARMNGFLERSHQEIDNPDREVKIDVITDSMASYESAFQRVVVLHEKRDTIVDEQLKKLGPSMEKDLTDLISSDQ